MNGPPNNLTLIGYLGRDFNVHASTRARRDALPNFSTLEGWRVRFCTPQATPADAEREIRHAVNRLGDKLLADLAATLQHIARDEGDDHNGSARFRRFARTSSTIAARIAALPSESFDAVNGLLAMLAEAEDGGLINAQDYEIAPVAQGYAIAALVSVAHELRRSAEQLKSLLHLRRAYPGDVVRRARTIAVGSTMTRPNRKEPLDSPMPRGRRAASLPRAAGARKAGRKGARAGQRRGSLGPSDHRTRVTPHRRGQS